MTAAEPRILVTRRWPGPVEAALASLGATLSAGDLPLSHTALQAASASYDVICSTVTDRMDSRVVDGAGSCMRLICNYGAGVDHIDLDACRRRGVVVTNTPDVLTAATAEIALFLMMAVARRTSEGEAELRAGGWTGWRPTHMLGTPLSGKCLGLVGFGRIGRETARLARDAFGMRIVYHARTRAPQPIEDIVGATYCARLDELLEHADIVSLHCPGDAETDGLINRASIARMKAHAILINTSRGSVIDEEALADALTAGRIAGAGLDVFRDEPRICERLLACPRTVLLPHLGSATVETRIAMGTRALKNLEAWTNGDEPPDRVA